MTSSLPSWRWRTLPVWMTGGGAFVLGWYTAYYGAGQPASMSRMSMLLLFAGLMVFSFTLSRILTRVTAAWVIRRKERQASRQENKRILSDPSKR